MQLRVGGNGLFRRALLGLAAVAVAVVCGFGIAAAASSVHHARSGVGKAKAPANVSAASAGTRARAAVGTAKAPVSAVRSHGHVLGLVAPLSGRAGGAAGGQSALRRSGGAALSRGRRVRVVARSPRARVMASALLDPTVTVGTQPTGVAVSATRAYVANQGSATVSVIDLTQNPPVVVASVAVGSAPDAVALSTDGARLYASNFFGGAVSVIDTATNTVTKTVDVGVGSRPTGVLEVGGSVYVASLGLHSVAVFDPAQVAPTASSFAVPATGAVLSAPSGLAASADGHSLYVNDARNGKTFVFDLTQNPPVSTGSVVNGAGTFPAYLAVAGTTGYSANPGTNSIRVLDLTALTATNVPVGTAPLRG